MNNILGIHFPLLSHFPYLGLFLLIILGSMGLPFPEDATLILSGFLAAHKVIKIAYAAPCLWAAILAGDFLIYSAGRKFGRKIVTHPKFQKILSSKRLSYLEEKFDRMGMLFILIGRHLVGLRSQLIIVSGVTRMPVWKFLLADGAASMITIAILGGLGYAGGSSLQIIRKDISRIQHVLVVVVVAALFCFLMVRYIRMRKPQTLDSRH
jgi:membrane protein DedA with SNARE-associated domain